MHYLLAIIASVSNALPTTTKSDKSLISLVAFIHSGGYQPLTLKTPTTPITAQVQASSTQMQKKTRFLLFIVCSYFLLRLFKSA